MNKKKENRSRIYLNQVDWFPYPIFTFTQGNIDIVIEDGEIKFFIKNKSK